MNLPGINKTEFNLTLDKSYWLYQNIILDDKVSFYSRFPRKLKKELLKTKEGYDYYTSRKITIKTFKTPDMDLTYTTLPTYETSTT